MIIDAKNAVLGRLASTAAKELLKGNDVVIFNAEKAIITGDRNVLMNKYLERRRRGSPQHGPFFPRQAQLIVRRTVRGMLPYKTNKGRTALRKLRVYKDEIKDLKEKPISLEKKINTKFVYVKELAKMLN